MENVVLEDDCFGLWLKPVVVLFWCVILFGSVLRLVKHSLSAQHKRPLKDLKLAKNQSLE